MYEYRAKVDRVVDGDTVDFIVDLGFKISFKIRTRLAGVNTPERGRADFKKATVMLENLLLAVLMPMLIIIPIILLYLILMILNTIVILKAVSIAMIC